jgi:ankyrin repeat protein
MRRSWISGVCAVALVASTASAGAAPAGVASVADAAKRQDATAVRALIRQRADVRRADAEGMTALHWAAHWGDLPLVRALLAAGADVNAVNRFGVTPLHEAATVGQAGIVGALLKAGAKANAAYGEGETVLMLAARSGSLPAVTALLEGGAAVNATESWRGQSALMMAAAENHGPIVKALLDAGANPNGRTKEYTFQALSGGAGGIIHDRPQGSLTPLILAARHGAIDSAQLLITKGADLDAAEPQYGYTALMTAIFNGKYSLAKMLIDRGADVSDGSLYVAMEMRNLARYTNRPNPAEVDGGVSAIDIAKLILAKGADPNARYDKLMPPRQAQGNINVASGATALQRAVRAVDMTSVKLLLDAGADPGQALDDGSTPLMVVAGLAPPRGGDEEVTEAGDRNDPVEMLKLLVEKGAPVGVANAAGMTALHFAVQRGSDAMVEYLAAKGARFDARNAQGRTPADLAKGRTAALVAKLTGGAAPAAGSAAPAGASTPAPAATPR